MEQIVVDRPLAGVEADPAVLWVRAACSPSRTASETAEALGWCDQTIGCVAVPIHRVQHLAGSPPCVRGYQPNPTAG